ARVLADARGRAPAAGDRAGIGTVLLAAFEYLHTQQHLHGAGFVSAGPTCLSSPASVCRACSHAAATFARAPSACFSSARSFSRSPLGQPRTRRFQAAGSSADQPPW